MGSIADEHVEWAVVNRLKAMLDAPPKTTFNVTQSFALFSAILLWTKQRAWVGSDWPNRRRSLGQADQAAAGIRDALRSTCIFEPPWLLSKLPPKLAAMNGDGGGPPVDAQINVDFDGMTAEQFVKWLRNALAHGDGRSIRPIHKPSRRGNKTLLAGFEVWATARGDRERLLTLYHTDMKRIGAVLADTFCKALSGGDRYFEQEAGTASIKEAT